MSFGHFLVPCIDDVVNPGRKRLANDGVAHIDQKLPGQLVPVDFFGEELQHLRVLLRLGKDVLYG